MAEMISRMRKELVGKVLNNQMKQSAVVEVTRLVQHPTYGKVVKQRKKYVVHDEKQEAKIGANVRIRETRPISKTKHWRLVEVLKG